MRLTGFVRKIDVLGRITLPAELRKKIGVEIGGHMEIFLDEGKHIVLRRYQPSDCDAYTGELAEEELVEFEGKKVSRSNIRKMAELAGLNVVE